MPRERKQKLKKRKDGRYACRYKSQWFYASDPDECLKLREEYKEAERRGRIMAYYVSEYAFPWLERSRPDSAPSTINGLKKHLQKMCNVIGDFLLEDVKPSDMKRIYAHEYKGLSNSYINAGKQLFCAMFDSAVADGLILSNPARDRTAKPHKGKVGGHRAITDQEREWIETLCVNHRVRPVVMAMLYSGIRPQEAKALVIDRDIDFENETITVRETAHIDKENAQKYAFSPQGKTDKANRQIPLLPPLKQALQGKQGHLITSAHGKPVTIQTWKVAWNSYRHRMETEINGMQRRWYGRTREHREILAAGGVLPQWVEFTVVPYDLRHSFCTMCRDNGVELNTCRQWMGHADTKMILKVYDSVRDNRADQEAEKLKNKWIRSQNGSQIENTQPVNGET